MTLAEAIAEEGGLVTLSQISQKWPWSRTRVHELSKQPGFPSPVCELSGGQLLYTRRSLDEWRSKNKKRQHRRRKVEMLHDQ